MESQTSIIKLRQIVPELWRGGQPDREGMFELAKLGIKTVVSLRWHTETIRQERDWAREAGLNYVPLPLSYVILPTRKEIATFFEITEDLDKQPVYVHCKHGVDRTGMMIAFWRIQKLGWSADRAYAEMENMGFHKIRMRHFKIAVYRFAERVRREKRKGR